MSGKTLTDRFWQKVDKTPGHGPKGDCWFWSAYCDKDGYGAFSFSGRNVLAHRFAYCIAHFLDYKQLSPSFLVMHTCDTPRCVKPEHLTLGTLKENNADCFNKQRNAFGERNGSAKLTSKQVSIIRMIAKKGISKEAIGELLGMSGRAIGKLCAGHSWKQADDQTSTKGGDC